MKRIVLGLALTAPFLLRTAGAADFVMVEKGVARAPIVVAEEAPEATMQAVRELANYVRKTSGARPEVVVGDPDPTPAGAVWVGPHPKLAGLFPDADLEFEHPEEILLLCDGRNLAILGRDRVAGDKVLESGTVNAVYTFLEKRLGVRWLWPGALGEDILPRETIAFSPFEYRFHPPFRQRHFWPRNPRHWHRRQRIWFYSYTFKGGHGFTDWYQKYHEAHPEYFALRPDGTRKAPRPEMVKLCLSDPGVWKQWLDNAEQKLRDDPSLVTVSGSPNDGPWHCVCERCRSWDHPDAPQGVLTERHVKFWNILARGLRERFPDREVYVAAMAYAAYSTPPIEEKLEKNIAVAQVGYFPLTTPDSRKRQKEEWKKWADMATVMMYRPNLWYWGGGVWGLPEVAMKKTIEDFRFLADNKCVGIIVDVLRNQWATQGPQYYIMAQLAYDPYQDGEAVMKDYYRRGLGPPAPEIEENWDLMQEGQDTFMSQPDLKLGSANRFKLPAIMARVYSEDFLGRAESIMARAEAKAAEGPEIYGKRVAFVRAGLEYTRLLMANVPLMTRIRESDGLDAEAIRQVTKNWEAIERISKEAAPYAVSSSNIRTWITGKAYMGGMQDYFGPPSEELLKSAREGNVNLAPAKWKLSWTDDFDRAELGGDWQALAGAWRLENGSLVSKSGGRLVTTRKFPGLQKVEFEVSVTPNPGETVSDMDPVIRCDEKGAGYLMQVGGYYNTRSSIQRTGRILSQGEHKIVPSKVSTVVAELDGNKLRLSVDGKTLHENTDLRPPIDAAHDHIGFYSYQGIVKIDRVKVYTSEAVPQVAMEGEGFE